MPLTVYYATQRLLPHAMTAVIDQEKCTACGECVSSCPLESISINEETQTAYVDFDSCGECGVCIGVCPVEAISL